MSMRPEPSPPPCWAAPPPLLAALLLGELLLADARGASLASAARLPSENKTEFSLRSPRSLLALDDAFGSSPSEPEPAIIVDALDAADAGADARAPNRSPASSPPSSAAEVAPRPAAANRSPGSLRTVPAS